MSTQVYNWRRFWCPRSGRINLADDGYVYDPDIEWGKLCNPDLVTFESISHLPCLALLGEPGIGKTQALKAEQSKIVSKIQEQGDQVIFLDLRSYGSEDRLVRNLFDSSEFKAWQSGAHRLHIFLDSFDECLLRLDTLATLLVDEFKGYQNEICRLCLRIACRTAIWPLVLEEGLKKIWGEDSVGVYELAPLRQTDVVQAAKVEGCSPEDFLKEVNQKNLVPLAIKPITLRFLLNTYQCNGDRFPPNQKLYELYFQGCKLLCKEINESRQTSNRKGDLDADQRLIVTARIAAITIFTNRFAVWTGVDEGNVPIEDILLQRLCHGYETVNGRKFGITEAVIKEVLDTGLFSARGAHRMGWAHQTYAEFLAAWYLVQHEMPLEKIRALIFSPEDSNRKLVPQLYETSAWIASMSRDVCQEMIESDPDVLLSSDIPTDSDFRKAIVTSLLTQYEQEKLYGYCVNIYWAYEKLKHPDLASQLNLYIQDPTKKVTVRNTAIDIAGVCKVSELQEELANLALNSSESIHLRVSAANALCSMGDGSARLKLKPLAIEKLPEDENDELKGYALKSIWPAYLTAEELFQALTPPKMRNFLGGYQGFIHYELVPQLHPDDLVVALDWLKGQGVRVFGHPFEELGDAILFKAWENFDLPGVPEIFTQVALVQWKQYQRIITHDSKLQEQFDWSLAHDSKKRRILIEQAVLIVSETDEDPSFLLSSFTENILMLENIFWMLEKLQSANFERTAMIWGELIRDRFDRQDVNQIDAILLATQTNIDTQTNKILREVFSHWLSSIELKSIQADKLRADYARMREIQERRQNPPLLNPPPKKRVLLLLDKLESGDLSAWWQLNRQMTLKPNSIHFGDDFELNLKKLPGWQEADEATQKRMVLWGSG